MATPFLLKFSNQFRSTERSAKALSAFNLAEAGVDRSIYELNNYLILPWDYHEDGSLSAIIDNFQASDGAVIGSIEIYISPVTGSNRFLEATGKIPYISSMTVDRTVLVNLEKRYRSIFDFGFFADDYIHAKTNWALDSYNSDNGPYDSMNPGDEGHAGTNGTEDGDISIFHGQSSEITGDLVAGYGTTEDRLNDVIDLPREDPDWLGGERKVLPAPFELPPVNVLELPPYLGTGESSEDPMFEVPPELDLSNWFDTLQYDGVEPLDLGWVNPPHLKGDFVADQHQTVTLGPGDSGVYTNFIMNNHSEVIIEGDVALFVTGGAQNTGEFLMSVGTTLRILPDSSLTLILGNTTFEMINNTVVNETLNPSHLLILGTEEFVPLSPESYTMYWNNNVDTYAAIYVPGARVKYEANTEMFGALICFSMDIKNNVNFHYDEALANLDLEGGVPYWAITSWQEKLKQQADI
jgi:hypothetical protein